MIEVNVFVCSFCKESFDSNDTITCHLLNAHDTDKTVKKLKKQLESRNPPTVRSSRLVKKEKTQVRNYSRELHCDICDYKTVHLSTYKRHLLTHEKDGRKHKCMHCSYAAIQPNNLKIHLETMHPFGAVEPVVIVDKDYMTKFQEKFS